MKSILLIPREQIKDARTKAGVAPLTWSIRCPKGANMAKENGLPNHKINDNPTKISQKTLILFTYFQSFKKPHN